MIYRKEMCFYFPTSAGVVCCSSGWKSCIVFVHLGLNSGCPSGTLYPLKRKCPPRKFRVASSSSFSSIVSAVKNKRPRTPLVLYVNGNGRLLERLKGTGIDVIGLDCTVDMEDARKQLGWEISVRGNVDPTCLFSPLPTLTEEINRVVRCAGFKGDPFFNLGDGVLARTPEEAAVAHFFEVARSLNYDMHLLTIKSGGF